MVCWPLPVSAAEGMAQQVPLGRQSLDSQNTSPRRLETQHDASDEKVARPAQPVPIGCRSNAGRKQELRAPRGTLPDLNAHYKHFPCLLWLAGRRRDRGDFGPFYPAVGDLGKSGGLCRF
jgi:hypothetical protein